MLQEENNIIKQVEVATNLIKCNGRTVAAATGRGFESRRPDSFILQSKGSRSEAFIESYQHSSGALEVPLQSDTMTISRAHARARIAFTLRLSPPRIAARCNRSGLRTFMKSAGAKVIAASI